MPRSKQRSMNPARGSPLMELPAQRYLRSSVLADLRKRLVLIGGPRQVGKTTFALSLLSGPREGHPAHLSWDSPEGRDAILKGRIPAGEPLVILDEVHKYPGWRNAGKSLLDSRGPSVAFLITDSAQLDHYRHGGDPLPSRYPIHRLHPFSAREIAERPTPGDVEHLLHYGGFPEPLREGSARFLRRWQREHMARIIHGDIRDLETMRDAGVLALLAEELPGRVGSPLSVRSLAGLLGTSPESVERWISILERFYVCFRIPPYGPPAVRAVKKGRKPYLWDWSRVPSPEGRFENLVACQLLKYCHLVEDTEGFLMELRYLRDAEKREVDFVVLKDRKPLFAVDCGSGDGEPASAFRYFRERTEIPAFYQTHRGTADYGAAETGVRMIPFHRLCQELQLP
jgi:uncharacterized protein